MVKMQYYNYMPKKLLFKFISSPIDLLIGLPRQMSTSQLACSQYFLVLIRKTKTPYPISNR